MSGGHGNLLSPSPLSQVIFLPCFCSLLILSVSRRSEHSGTKSISGDECIAGKRCFREIHLLSFSQCGWDVEITTEMRKQLAALKCIKCISCQSKYLLERKSMWKGVVSGKDLGEQVRRMLQAVLEVMRMRNSSRKRLAGKCGDEWEEEC